MAIRRFKTSSFANNLPRYGKMWDQVTDFKFKRAFIIGASTGFYYTEDGTTWTSTTYPFPNRSINDGAGYSWCIALKNGTMFATGTTSSTESWIYKSDDGITWTSVTPPRTGSTGDGYLALHRGNGAYGSRLYVFNVGGSTAAWYSDNNGANWTSMSNNLSTWNYPSTGDNYIINFPYIYNPTYYDYALPSSPGTYTRSGSVSGVGPNYLLGSVYANGHHFVGGAYGGGSTRAQVRISDTTITSYTVGSVGDGNNTVICDFSSFGYIYGYAGATSLSYNVDTSASSMTALSGSYRAKKGTYFKGTDGIGRMYLAGNVATSNNHIVASAPTTLTAITYPIAPTFYLANPDPLVYS